jgi:hypothetical protein
MHLSPGFAFTAVFTLALAITALGQPARIRDKPQCHRDQDFWPRENHNCEYVSLASGYFGYP